MNIWNSTFRNPGKPLKRNKPRSMVKPSARSKSVKVSWFKTAKQRGNGEDKLCRGQQCFLQIPGICCNDPQTVVPCHSNQSRHGKGMGHKAEDIFTVPGCWLCHREIDQGKTFTKEEKFAIWDAAYAEWEPVRDRLMAEKLGEAA